MRRLGFTTEPLVTAYQVHSARVVVVEDPWPEKARPKADAMVTRKRGVVLGILTADCAPVLLADARAGVIGAAHAGWRGAKSGVLAETLAAMLRLGARLEEICVAVGPCIRHNSYEVGPEFHAAFLADEPTTTDLFRPSTRDRHFHFDLAGYVGRKLRSSGLDRVSVLPHDTFADEHRFFSYRRATMRREGDYGRLLSTIGMVR